jgi:hypothetical protein
MQGYFGVRRARSGGYWLHWHSAAKIFCDGYIPILTSLLTWRCGRRTLGASAEVCSCTGSSLVATQAHTVFGRCQRRACLPSLVVGNPVDMVVADQGPPHQSLIYKFRTVRLSSTLHKNFTGPRNVHIHIIQAMTGHGEYYRRFVPSPVHHLCNAPNTLSSPMILGTRKCLEALVKFIQATRAFAKSAT